MTIRQYESSISNGYPLLGTYTFTVPYFGSNIVPTISTSPVGVTNYAGQPWQVSALAAGDTPLVYQWRKNSNAIAGATATAYTATFGATNDTGWYDVVVTNYPGSTTSNPVLVSILPVTGALSVGSLRATIFTTRP